ncbi:MAG: hypothetical protein U0231_07910 [Nitrospiraceae bacterium]
MKDLRAKCSIPVEDGPLSLDMLRYWIPHVRTLVHCTPVGMSPKVDDGCVPTNLLRPELTVMDIVYSEETKLLQDEGGGMPDDFRAGDVPQPSRDAVRALDRQPGAVDVMRQVLESRFQ